VFFLNFSFTRTKCGPSSRHTQSSKAYIINHTTTFIWLSDDRICATYCTLEQGHVRGTQASHPTHIPRFNSHLRHQTPAGLVILKADRRTPHRRHHRPKPGRQRQHSTRNKIPVKVRLVRYSREGCETAFDSATNKPSHPAAPKRGASLTLTTTHMGELHPTHIRRFVLLQCKSFPNTVTCPVRTSFSCGRREYARHSSHGWHSVSVRKI
jgi:hypothetical protein